MMPAKTRWQMDENKRGIFLSILSSFLYIMELRAVSTLVNTAVSTYLFIWVGSAYGGHQR
jgi:hypothetical protein